MLFKRMSFVLLQLTGVCTFRNMKSSVPGCRRSVIVSFLLSAIGFPVKLNRITMVIRGIAEVRDVLLRRKSQDKAKFRNQSLNRT